MKTHKHNYDPILKGCDTCKPKSQHTPTPWKLDGNWIVSGFFGVHELPASNEGSQAEHLANAAFIVRAVNSHEELLVALKTEHLEASGCEGNDDCTTCSIIAKAEGK